MNTVTLFTHEHVQYYRHNNYQSVITTNIDIYRSLVKKDP